MNPAAQLSCALLAGLVLWLPSFAATMRGDLELPAAAMRYLLSFFLARVAIGFLAHLVAGYAVEVVPVRTEPVPEPLVDLAEGEDVLDRRKDDATS